MNTSVSAAPLLADRDRSIDAHVRHRLDLDGLRALAALSVIAVHSFPTLPGGQTGVDMFFVLSGFLISGILLRALASDAFSFSDFYARRVRRIFPALIAVLLTVWIIGSALLLPNEYRQLGKDVATSAAFSLYIFKGLENYFGYLEIDHGWMLLLQLWSLGVEEQFYLLWPMFLLTVWKLSARRIQYVTLSVATVTFVSFAFLVAQDSRYGIRLVPWRGLWELSAGGRLACFQLGGLPLRTRSFASPSGVRTLGLWLINHHVLGAISVGLLILAIVSNPRPALFSGSWTLAPALGTMLFILAGPQSFINKHFFGSAPMVFIGQISYPLYLWHFPVDIFIGILSWDRHPSPPAMFAIVTATSFVLAFLTYKFVEIPIRFRARKSTVLTLAGLAAICGAIGVSSSLGWVRPLQYFRGDDLVRSATEDWLKPPGSDSWTKYPDGVLTLGHSSRHALFIGDSNLQQYYQRIEKLVSTNAHIARNAIFATRYGCAPGIVEVHASNKQEKSACRKHLSDALAYAADPNVDVVVIAAAWYAHLVEIRDLDTIGQLAPLKPDANLAIDELKKTLNELTTNGKRTYLVLNLPVGARFDPRAHMPRTKLVQEKDLVDYAEKDKIMAALEPTTSRLREVARETGATIIDPLQSLCGVASCPYSSASGEWMYRDLWHLRPSYVRDHVRYLDAVILEP